MSWLKIINLNPSIFSGKLFVGYKEKKYHEKSTRPKRFKKNTDDKKITNEDEKVVNKKTENKHEATNEENWVHDVNEEFGDDFVLPDEEDTFEK